MVQKADIPRWDRYSKIVKVFLHVIFPVALGFWLSLSPTIKAGSFPVLLSILLIAWLLAVLTFIFADDRINKRKLNKDDKANVKIKADRDRFVRAYQSLDEMISGLVLNLLDQNGKPTSEIKKKIEDLISPDDWIIRILTHLYHFYRYDPRNEAGQAYRLILMEPVNDNNLEIKHWQMPEQDKPICVHNSVFFKKDYSTAAGYAWQTLIPMKIPDIHKYCEEHRNSPQECHFQLFNGTQRSTKSIFSIPLYDEPKADDSNFYGVLNITTDKCNRFIDLKQPRDPQLEIIKPFIKLLTYCYKVKKNI